MNPTRRRRTTRRRRKLYGAAAAAHARKVGGGRRRSSSRRRRSSRRVVHTVSHRVRRNPTARRSRTHSPAMRAKISRAVKAAQRRRKSGGGGVVRRSFSAIRRRSSGGGGGGGSFNLTNPFKQLFSKQVLTVAGGAVASSFLTQFILTRYGASLPMANQTFGRVAYKLLIPVAGAAAVKRFNRDLASGMLIGGAVMAINELIASFVPRAGGTQVAALKSYGEGEYDGEADYATDTYMADVATGMPSALSGDDESLGEYFQGEDPFDSAPAFEAAF